MKKLLEKTIVFALLGFAQFLNAQCASCGTADQNYICIPDASFEKVLYHKYGTSSNGTTPDILGDCRFPRDRALNITNLYLQYSVGYSWFTLGKITNLTGIEGFTNLTSLNCSRNAISSLNISMLSSLKTLNCNENLLTSLNVTGLSSLKQLRCATNNLTILNLPNVASVLDTLDCRLNNLTTLNLANSTNLEQLLCSNNCLYELDLRGLNSLIDFYCLSNNSLSCVMINNTPLPNWKKDQKTDWNNTGVACCVKLNGINFSPSSLILCPESGSLTANPTLACREESTVNFSYNWTGPNGFTANTQTTPNLPQVAGTYTCTISNPNGNGVQGCFVSKNITVGITPTCCVAGGRTYVPDDNFEQALIELGYDNVLDNYVLTNNISAVTSLDVSARDITNVTGLKCFKNLELLNLRDNVLETIDLDGLNKLKHLNITCIHISSVDLSDQVDLENLEIAYNPALLSLNLQNQTKLKYLNCGFNGLTTLNLSYCPDIQIVEGNGNFLNYLNLDACIDLYRLSIAQNEMISIDLSDCIRLYDLDLRFNSFTTLDLSCTNLYQLNMTNNSFPLTIYLRSNQALSIAYTDLGTQYQIGGICTSSSARKTTEQSVEENTNISSFPNPISSGGLFFGKTAAKYELRAMSGELISNGFNVRFIEIKDLAPGVYILIKDDQIEKIIVE